MKLMWSAHVIWEETGHVYIGASEKAKRRLSKFKAIMPQQTLLMFDGQYRDRITVSRIVEKARDKLRESSLPGNQPYKWFTVTPVKAVTAVREAAAEMGVELTQVHEHRWVRGEP
jgi:ferredoxin-NADP reductase